MGKIRAVGQADAYYVGIDKRESQSRICVMDGSGKEVRSWTQWGPPEETAELDRVARRDTRVRLLMTIPGVGMRTAETVVAYIDRAERFSAVRDSGACAGLVPCQDQSGPVERLGHITREGPPALRRLLVEAAWQGLRKSPAARRMQPVG